MTGPVLGLIPARGGSKGVPNKNLRPIAGHPLIAYSIAAARMSKAIDRVVVSTDSQTIAEVARAYGAETPFMRPGELARDDSPDLEYVVHALNELERQEDYVPSMIAQLRPTTPLRDPALMDRAVTNLAARPDATSLRAVQQLAEPPQKMMGIENGLLTGLFPDDPRPEYYNLPRQVFPPAYLPNGYIDIVRTDVVRSRGVLYGPEVLAFEVPPSLEIDTPEDLERLEWAVDKGRHPCRVYLDEKKDPQRLSADLRHAGIVVSDLERSLSFYREALGFVETARADETGPFLDGLLNMPSATVTTVKLRGTTTPGQIELLSFKTPKPFAKAETALNTCGITHLALQVGDLDRLFQSLQGMGITFNAPPAVSPDGRAKVAFCRDPDGVFLELVELLEQS
jgi:CMP-N-acetylneuraminic acid synthetase/catechol 2,3-dioxygenase-like lactoylglutathione lyase family enzyme